MDMQQLIQKIEVLPESVQLQVNDYIDFLIVRYISTIDTAEKEEETVATKELKALLDESELHHAKNSDKAQPGFEFLDGIAKKYDYEI